MTKFLIVYKKYPNDTKFIHLVGYGQISSPERSLYNHYTTEQRETKKKKRVNESMYDCFIYRDTNDVYVLMGGMYEKIGCDNQKSATQIRTSGSRDGGNEQSHQHATSRIPGFP
jgi:hypothetical protein